MKRLDGGRGFAAGGWGGGKDGTKTMFWISAPSRQSSGAANVLASLQNFRNSSRVSQERSHLTNAAPLSLGQAARTTAAAG